ncbi:uncharacterized protein LOC129707495 [Leucoraja erinacea]|uniref:uncharacterized protein LOC129707495 n=1 Tax=Leucoraja erinaceus TaxID=7782 RepID=UPI002453C2FA|nr:uncharacterized protein LOC129707495 [Leucoraja erinacea]
MRRCVGAVSHLLSIPALSPCLLSLSPCLHSLSPCLHSLSLPACSLFLPLFTLSLPACTLSLPACSLFLPACTLFLPLFTLSLPACTLSLPACTLSLSLSLSPLHTPRTLSLHFHHRSLSPSPPGPEICLPWHCLARCSFMLFMEQRQSSTMILLIVFNKRLYLTLKLFIFINPCRIACSSEISGIMFSFKALSHLRVLGTQITSLPRRVDEHGHHVAARGRSTEKRGGVWSRARYRGAPKFCSEQNLCAPPACRITDGQSGAGPRPWHDATSRLQKQLNQANDRRCGRYPPPLLLPERGQEN